MRKRGSIPQGVRFEVFRRDKFTCRYCGRASPAVVLHVEHVVPVVAGGDDTPGNLVTACADCNNGKGATTGVEPPAEAETSDSGAGLAGLWAHELEGRWASRQMRILRRYDDAHWLVELHSWFDGTGNAVEVVAEADLFSARYVLYASAAAMDFAYHTRRRMPDRLLDRELARQATDDAAGG